MKTNLLFVVALLAGANVQAQDCSELFISEYVEGIENNKALEIYNPTNSSINLSQYMVIRYSNGSASAASSNAISLTGTLAAKDVHVAVLDKRDAMGTGLETPVWQDLQDKADAFYSPVYATNDAFYWNGNDAVVLAKGSPSNIAGAIIVDLYGRVGENPGNGSDPETGWTTVFPYTGAGESVSVDHSSIRKASILKGRTNPTMIFDPLAEWDSIPGYYDDGTGTWIGNWATLGNHQCACGNASVEVTDAEPFVQIYPNPTTGTFAVFGANSFVKMSVFNSVGQEIVNMTELNMIQEVTLDGQRGVYFVVLTDAAGSKITNRVVLK